MRHTLTFGTVSFSNYSCFYDGSQMWRKPEKIVDFYSVPGRNGDISVSQNKYSNIVRPLNCYINKNWASNYNGLIDALSAIEGYARFETSEETDVYMMASLNDEIQPKLDQFNKSGQFTLNFNFKPQKWLKTGENAIAVSSSETLVNPSHQIALPMIEVTGTGSITINTSVLTLATNTSTTIIDCETQDAYEGTINRNGDLTVTNGFPVLSASNTVTVTGFTTCNIYPRWWRL